MLIQKSEFYGLIKVTLFKSLNSFAWTVDVIIPYSMYIDMFIQNDLYYRN